MEKKKIGILFGGKSGEHEVSISSAMSIYNALDKNKYQITLVGIDKSGRWLLPEQTKLLAQAGDPRKIRLESSDQNVCPVPYESKNALISQNAKDRSRVESIGHFDVILPILHGTYGEDGTMQGLLELANVAYVGSGVLGSALGMDKDVSKRLFSAAGIPVVPWRLIRRATFERNPSDCVDEIVNELGLPFFVKPANAGSSVGVYKIKNISEAQTKIRQSLQYDHKVLCEKAIVARELEVSVLGNDNPKASIVGEIVPHHEFYSYEAKYLDENGAELLIPAKDLHPDLQEKIKSFAVCAFQAIECRGLARVDFFLDKTTGALYLNEINTIPGFTKISMYPKLWEASGISYSDLLDELIRLAEESHQQKINLLSFERKENS